MAQSENTNSPKPVNFITVYRNTCIDLDICDHLLNVAHKTGASHKNGRCCGKRSQTPRSLSPKRRRLDEPRSSSPVFENKPRHPVFNSGAPKFTESPSVPSRSLPILPSRPTEHEPCKVVELDSDSPKSPDRGASLGYAQPMNVYRGGPQNNYIDAEDAFYKKYRDDLPNSQIGLLSTKHFMN